MQAADLFSLSDTFPFRDRFPGEAKPWEWLPLIKEVLKDFDFDPTDLPSQPGVHIKGDVYLAPSVKLPPYCVIEGPAWIGPETEIRPGAYIRGNVIVGAGCVLGNACEFKNCLLMDDVQTPHYNYVGDSILGNKSHLGAGVICSNLRLDQKHISVVLPDGVYETGLRKFGAILADAAEVGCNAALQPGTILAKRSVVGPALAFGGYLEPQTMAFGRAEIRRLPRRD
ncbi:UDP-N-acetylglucosamine diphosphorylase [Rubellicoccus peritrichatus]|uniref:UDP-N-acetylglucosamine diphosphorylase n=1 Tax=Rubellicoccus peritrichatus TaxID=3080537 RepID=A0AAQ3QVS3_9BACT|nr:UDP-N-acetylglucosamine diphosphorylase [Puniceicoccus sp. CR14]WOO41147.1 UDP-N-acetylglucosamine diphosphorylase [Puniceicoccus sp. CR14]